MEILLWVLISALLCALVAICAKLHLVKKTAEEIERELYSRLITETNTLIDVSYRDKTMCSLADTLNKELSKLREERHKFRQGDTELKEAVTNISHDLRTPLTAICGYLELLEEEEKTEESKRYIEQIENRVETLKQLTEELFRYSVVASVQDISEEAVELRPLLEECLASFYGAVKQRGIRMEVCLTEHKVQRSLDRSAVNRIFSNIISNAIKYSDGDLQVWMGEDGTVTFANTAADMDAVAAARLFDRFYTVETGRNSTGLGLSIAKLLTERMGGEIGAVYNEGMLIVTVKFSGV